jgi:chromosome segregation ATPase
MGLTREALKKEILQMLKEDEEFRLAVAGLIGLSEILEELRALREKSLQYDKHFATIERKLLEHDKRFEALERKLLEHDKRFEAIERKLLEHDRRFEALERKLLEHDKRFEAIERKLLEHDKRFELIEKKLLEHDRRFEAIERKLLEHDKRFEVIERKLLEHDKRFEAIERKLLEHDKRFEVLERKLLEHDKRFEAIERKLSEHDRHFERIERRLSGLELTVGSLAESMYSRFLWEDIRVEIRERGERVLVRRRNARVDGEDIDLLVVTDASVYVVEVKVKPKKADVGALLAKAEIARRRYPGRRVVAVLAGSLVGDDVEEYASEKGVLVYTY